MSARRQTPPTKRLASATRRALFVVAALAVALMWAAVGARAESLKITSVPAGANVELNGLFVGQTPLSLDYPGDYFHKPHTAFGERLGHAMMIRVYKPGFVTKSMTLSDGPMPWVGLGGKQHGTYFVLRAKHFEFALDSTSDVTGAALGDEERPGPMRAAHRDVSAAAAARASVAADAAAETGTVVVASDPMGAEIYVDGDFVGQTPSTLHVSGGLHHVEIRAGGRKTWTREMQINKGSQVSVKPVLEPAETAVPASAKITAATSGGS
jgi:hypothetical protein